MQIQKASNANRLIHVPGAFVIIGLFLPSGFLTLSIVLFFLSCCLQADWGLSLSKQRILLFPVLLFSLYAAGYFLSPDPALASKIIIRKLPLLMLPLGFIVLDKIKMEKFLYYLPELFLIMCIACSFLCYWQAMISIVQHHSFVNPAGDRQGDYYYYSYHALAMPSGIDPIYLTLYFNLALVIALTTISIRRKSLQIATALYISIFIFLLASKIGIVIFIFVMISWAFATMHSVKTALLLLVLLPVGILGMSKLPFLRERFSSPYEFDYKESDSGKWTSSTFRLAIWSCAGEAIRNNPIVGYGTGGGQQALESIYLKRKFVRGELDHYNAHNEYLNATLDIGLIGPLLLISMVGSGLILGWKRNDFQLIGFLIVMTIGFCVETILLRQKGIVLFAFFFCLFVARANSTKAPVR